MSCQAPLFASPSALPKSALSLVPNSRRTSAGRHGAARPKLKSNRVSSRRERRVSRLYFSTGLARWFKIGKHVRSAGVKASATPGMRHRLALGLQLEADRGSIESLNRVHDCHYVPGGSKGLDSAIVLRLAAQLDEAHEQSSKWALEATHTRRHTLEPTSLVRDFGRIAATVGVSDQRSGKRDVAEIVQDELRSQRTASEALQNASTSPPASCVLSGALDLKAWPGALITAIGPALAAAVASPLPETPVAPAGPWAQVASMGLPSKRQLDDLRCFGELNWA